MRIFIKTLKEELIITIVFCIVIVAALFLVIQEFAVAKHLDFSAFVQDVPEAFRQIAEAFLVLNVFGGYLHIVASVAWIIVGSIFVSLISTALIAREAERKTLPLLLAHPVSRFQIIMEKYGAAILYILVFTAFSFLGFYLGTYHGVVEVPYKAYRYIIVCVNGFLYFVALGSVGLLFSTIFNEQKKAAVTTLLFFALSYLVFFLGAFSPKWAKIKQFTLFRFFDTEKLFMSTEFKWVNINSLLIITIILIAASALIFHRKDISE